MKSFKRILVGCIVLSIIISTFAFTTIKAANPEWVASDTVYYGWTKHDWSKTEGWHGEKKNIDSFTPTVSNGELSIDLKDFNSQQVNTNWKKEAGSAAALDEAKAGSGILMFTINLISCKNGKGNSSGVYVKHAITGTETGDKAFRINEGQTKSFLIEAADIATIPANFNVMFMEFDNKISELKATLSSITVAVSESGEQTTGPTDPIDETTTTAPPEETTDPNAEYEKISFHSFKSAKLWWGKTEGWYNNKDWIEGTKSEIEFLEDGSFSISTSKDINQGYDVYRQYNCINREVPVATKNVYVDIKNNTDVPAKVKVSISGYETPSDENLPMLPAGQTLTLRLGVIKGGDFHVMIQQVNTEFKVGDNQFEVSALYTLKEKPSETDPSETDPSETDPSETDPSETDPSETDPSETDPSETDPSETDPSETETTTDGIEIIPKLDESGPYFQVETVTVKPGATAEVAVKMVNNPGVWAMKFSLKYDNDVIKLIATKAGVFDGGTILSSPITNDIYTFTFEGNELDADVDGDGVVITLTFEVSKEAQEGEYPIQFTQYDPEHCFNAELENLPFTFGNGIIIVANEEATTKPLPSETTTEPLPTETTTETTTASKADKDKADEIHNAYLEVKLAKMDSSLESKDILKIYTTFLNLYQGANDNVKQLLKEKGLNDLIYFEVLTNIIDEYFYATDKDLAAAGLTADDYYNFIEEFIQLYENADEELLNQLKEKEYDSIYQSYLDILKDRKDDVGTGSVAAPITATVLAAAALYLVTKSKKRA